MNTKDIGDVSVGKIIGRLVKEGRTILLPFGDNARYDLVLDDQGIFTRVQCKTGHPIGNAIHFKTVSTNYKKGSWVLKNYVGDVDVFAVYCPETDEVFMVPMSVIENRNSLSLRLCPPLRPNGKRMVYAKDFVI